MAESSPAPPSEPPARWRADVEFADHMRAIAEECAPRLFAIVEERGERAGGRVAGYGLAHPGRADVNSVEGDFPLVSQSAERARQVFEVSAGSRGVRAHLVWLDAEGTGEAGGTPKRPAQNSRNSSGSMPRSAS